MTYAYLRQYFRLFTVYEVAMILGIDKSRVIENIRAGVLPAIRFEKMTRITPWALEIFANNLSNNNINLIEDFVDRFFTEDECEPYDLDEICHIFKISRKFATRLLTQGYIPYDIIRDKLQVTPDNLYLFIHNREMSQDYSASLAWYESPEDADDFDDVEPFIFSEDDFNASYIPDDDLVELNENELSTSCKQKTEDIMFTYHPSKNSLKNNKKRKLG